MKDTELLKLVQVVHSLSVVSTNFSHTLQAIADLSTDNEERVSALIASNLLLFQILLRQVGIPPSEFAVAIERHLGEGPGLEKLNAILRLHVETCHRAQESLTAGEPHNRESPHPHPKWFRGVIDGGLESGKRPE